MRESLRPAVLLLVTALVLTGCAAPGPSSGGVADATATESAAPTDASALDAEPATGEPISGTGYTFTAPEGWSDPQQEIPGFDPDSFAADMADTDGYVDNVNVLESPAGVVSADQVETLGLDELDAVGATDVVVNDRVTVAGSESAHISAALSTGGVSYLVDQYYVSTDDQTYIVTFSFSDTVPADERRQTAESVLVTWEWL